MKAAFSLCVSFLLAQTAQPVYATVTDCVGRMALTLPGRADIGASSFKSLFAELDVGSNQYGYEFRDGERAAITEVGYSGQLIASHPITKEQSEQLAMRAEEHIENSRQYQIKQQAQSVITRSKNMITWTSEKFATIYRELDGHAYYWHGWVDRSGGDAPNSAFFNLSERLQYRAVHTVPDGAGLCFPYGFVPDDGTVRRHISMAFRLIDHPDVTIYLEDASAAKPDKKGPPPWTLTQEMNFYWNQYPRIDYNETIESAYDLPKTRPVIIDKRRGLSSMVRVTRENGAKDYGYMAMVAGDPNAKQDTPDLRYLVLQNSASARSRNISPVSKARFLDIVKKVESSIRYRTPAAE